MAEARPQRIDNITAGLMIAVAVIFDLISLIPFVNFLSTIAAAMIFGLWFLFCGVGFVNPRRIATWAIGLLVEAIPILSILPGLTIAVAVTIFMVKLEDKTGLKLPAVKEGSFKQQRLKALHELSGREREVELGRIRKQESGELRGRALSDRGQEKKRKNRKE